MLMNYKLSIIRDDREIFNVVPELFENKDLFRLKINSSISKFPFAVFCSKISDVNKQFLSLSKTDFLSISTRKNESDEFRPYFKGILFYKDYQYNKDPEKTELEISAIHSFFKLSLIQFKDIRNYNNICFSDFITEIANLVNIRPNEISMTDEIKRLNIRLISYNANIFRMFKDICLQNNLSVNFEIDNTVTIEYTSDKVKRIFGQEPVATITQDDILSMSNTEGII